MPVVQTSELLLQIQKESCRKGCPGVFDSIMFSISDPQSCGLQGFEDQQKLIHIGKHSLYTI